MIDIIKPNRFYQIEYDEMHSGKVTRIIDLKYIKQMMLREVNNRWEIIVYDGNHMPLPPIEIEKKNVPNEVFREIVVAWTTYKLSTES